MLAEVPEWFVQDFQTACKLKDTDADRAAALWYLAQSRGWEGFRLLGGERLADGSLSKPEKMPTLVLPYRLVERPTLATRITGLS